MKRVVLFLLILSCFSHVFSQTKMFIAKTGGAIDSMWLSDVKSVTFKASPLSIKSSSFTEGQTIPVKHTYNISGQCSGQNYLPSFAWSNIPGGVQSYAIICIDPDGGNWVHWVQFNIPATTMILSEEIAGSSIGVKGVNDFGTLGYGGPCPPSGTHRYYFTLYALDITVGLTQGATKAQLISAMTGHILAQAQIMGTCSH